MFDDTIDDRSELISKTDNVFRIFYPRFVREETLSGHNELSKKLMNVASFSSIASQVDCIFMTEISAQQFWSFSITCKEQQKTQLKVPRSTDATQIVQIFPLQHLCRTRINRSDGLW